MRHNQIYVFNHYLSNPLHTIYSSWIQHAGASVAAYPNIAVWFERCRALRGFDENEEGARKFGARIAEKLVDKF